MNRNWILIAAASLCLAGCSGRPHEHVITIPAGPTDVTTATTPPPGFRVPADVFGDGSHRVIDEVKPGLYRTGGSIVADFPLCNWKLYAAPGDLVASGSATGPVSIVVIPEYTEVASTGCLEWNRVGDVP